MRCGIIPGGSFPQEALSDGILVLARYCRSLEPGRHLSRLSFFRYKTLSLCEFLFLFAVFIAIDFRVPRKSRRSGSELDRSVWSRVFCYLLCTRCIQIRTQLPGVVGMVGAGVAVAGGGVGGEVATGVCPARLPVPSSLYLLCV